MANWCSTDYHIHGSKKSIDKLTDLLMETWHMDNSWLGHVVEKLTNEECHIYARGFITDEPDRVDDENITLYCESAWTELHEWRHFIESQFDDVLIEFLATEPGCGVYQSNMEEYEDTYIVDDHRNGDYNFLCPDGVVDYINEHYDKDFKNLDDVLEWAKDDEELFINPIEIVE